jgi:opacity protein-like surface antigen
MFRSAIAVAVLGVACLAATATAAAQLNLPSARFGIGGGVTSPRNAYHANSLGEGFNTGWQGIAFLEFKDPKRPIGIRADFVISENPGNDQYNAAAGATTTMRLFGGELDVSYSVGSAAGIRAYLLAGGGAYQTTLWQDSATIAFPDQSENKFGWNAGAGVTLPAGPGALFLEARYVSVANSFISSGQAPFVAIVGGFRFGRG